MKKLQKFSMFILLFNIATQFYPLFSGTDNWLTGTRPLEFEQFSLEQGLSQCIVTSILQDRQGFLWFGTTDGLNKYDGYSFIIYKHRPNDPNSLSHNLISAIFEDHTGTLWVGTYQEGLNRFDREHELFVNYRNNPNDSTSLSHNTITAIIEDRQGNLWIGTAGGGLNKLVSDGNNIHFQRFKNESDNPNSLSNNYVTTIFEDHAGMLWIGTNNGGLNQFILNPTPTFNHFKNDSTNSSSLSSNKITTIFEDHHQALWIGTQGGGLEKAMLDGHYNLNFIHFKNDPTSPKSLSDNYVTRICADLSGALWIGTHSGGLNKLILPEKENIPPYFIHLKNNAAQAKSLRSNNIIALFADHSGVLWIGTYGAGINKIWWYIFFFG
jgi:ligand-binding sensor domain-containing protein